VALTGHRRVTAGDTVLTQGTGGVSQFLNTFRSCEVYGVDTMPLGVPPPRDSRFGSPLVLSRMHWVRPELVAEVKYLTWTDDNLLRQVVYEGLARIAGGRGAPVGAVPETRHDNFGPEAIKIVCVALN
jgi:hypothetical protein